MVMLYECEACKEGRHDECEVGHEAPKGSYGGSRCTCCGSKNRKFVLASFLDSPAAKALGRALRKADKERMARIANNPDNGKTGWWVVDGIRHSAHARASSAAEAIEKADKARLVAASWESPEARFWCKKLPDVF
jgi:hypothetical protein